SSQLPTGCALPPAICRLPRRTPESVEQVCATNSPRTRVSRLRKWPCSHMPTPPLPFSQVSPSSSPRIDLQQSQLPDTSSNPLSQAVAIQGRSTPSESVYLPEDQDFALLD